MDAPAEDGAGNLEGKQIGVTLFPFLSAQRFEEGGLRAANHLHAFAREILGKTRQRESGPIDRRLANDSFQTIRARDQFQFQGTGVLGVKPFNGDDIASHRKKWSDREEYCGTVGLCCTSSVRPSIFPSP